MPIACYGELRGRCCAASCRSGERLVEEQLAEEFQTSRTPVREALRRLEGDGHLVRDPAGGLRPRPAQRALDVAGLRGAPRDRGACASRRVATRATASCWRRSSGDWRTLRRARARAPAAAARPGLRARRRVVPPRASRRPRATSSPRALLREINDRIRILRIHDFTTEDRIGRRSPSTSRSSTRVLAGDADAAAAFMRAHVQRSALVVRERVGAALSRMAELERARVALRACRHRRRPHRTYAPRLAEFVSQRFGPWRLKLYGLADPAKGVRAELLDATRERAAASLPDATAAPPSRSPTTRAYPIALVYWWQGTNELHQRVVHRRADRHP